MSHETPGTVEIVLYRSRPGVADQLLVAASDAMQSDIEQFPGYISRRLMKTADGLRVDAVEWRSLAEAEAAAAAIMKRASVARFMPLVEESTIQMHHPVPVRAYAPARRAPVESVAASPATVGPGDQGGG